MEIYDVKELAGKLMQAAYIIMKVMESFNCVTTQFITLDEIQISFYLQEPDNLHLLEDFLQDEIPIYYKEMKIDENFPPTLELIL